MNIKQAPQAVKNLLSIFAGALVSSGAFHLLLRDFPNAFQFLFAFCVALAYGLILGLPAYFLIPLKLKRHWYTASIAGFIIGTIPLIFIIPGLVALFIWGFILVLPAYFLIPLKLKNHWYAANIAGFVIGIIPPLFLMLYVLLLIIFRETGGITPNLILLPLGAGLLGALGATSAWFVWSYLGYDFDKFKVGKNDD